MLKSNALEYRPKAGFCFKEDTRQIIEEGKAQTASKIVWISLGDTWRKKLFPHDKDDDETTLNDH